MREMYNSVIEVMHVGCDWSRSRLC
jgi:hypothetical protein